MRMHLIRLGDRVMLSEVAAWQGLFLSLTLSYQHSTGLARTGSGLGPAVGAKLPRGPPLAGITLL